MSKISTNAGLLQTDVKKGGIGRFKEAPQRIAAVRSSLYRRFWFYPALSRHVKGRVLDFDCRGGGFLRHHGGDIAGVDRNPKFVSQCKRQGSDAKVMTGDEIPFEDDVFDSVILDNVLGRCDEPKVLLKEISRVLRPGGTVLVSTPGMKGYACDGKQKFFYNEHALDRLFFSTGFDRKVFFYLPFKSQMLSRGVRNYQLCGTYLNIRP